MRYAVVPVPKQAPSYLPGLALMATTPGRRRLSRHIEQEGGVSPKIATPRLRSAGIFSFSICFQLGLYVEAGD
jgi:hypothetical protein